MYKKRFLLLPASLLAFSCASAQLRPAPVAYEAPVDGRTQRGAASQWLQPQTVGREYKIGPNDLLDIDILNLDKDPKRTVRVNAAGAVSLPLIGSVAVAGLSAQQAEEVIAQRYSEKYLQDPQVSVFVKEFTTERITVEGAVARPGIFPLTGQMTLLRALALAGGFGSLANTGEVMLFRVNEQKVRQVAVFDIDEIRAGRSEDPGIRGDDLIVVQQNAARRMFKDSLFRDIVDSINPFSVFSR